MKISEAFQKAIDEKIPRIEGTYADDKGGFCARGLLLEYGIDDGPLSSWLWADYDGKGAIVMANDRLHWSWKKFRDYAKSKGL